MFISSHKCCLLLIMRPHLQRDSTVGHLHFPRLPIFLEMDRLMMSMLLFRQRAVRDPGLDKHTYCGH